MKMHPFEYPRSSSTMNVVQLKDNKNISLKQQQQQLEKPSVSPEDEQDLTNDSGYNSCWYCEDESHEEVSNNYDDESRTNIDEENDNILSYFEDDLAAHHDGFLFDCEHPKQRSHSCSSSSDITLTSHDSVEENLECFYYSADDERDEDATSVCYDNDENDDDDDDHCSHSTTDAIAIDDDVLNVHEVYDETPVPVTKEVRFGPVRIREYNVIVGACTAVEDTCPLQLGWEYKEHDRKFVQLESYDIYKMSKRLKEQQKQQRFQSQLTKHQQQQQHTIHIQTPTLQHRHSNVMATNYPQRLSIDERRLRIARVHNISLQEVENMEFETFLEAMKYQKQQHSPEQEPSSSEEQTDSSETSTCIATDPW